MVWIVIFPLPIFVTSLVIVASAAREGLGCRGVPIRTISTRATCHGLYFEA